MMKRTESQNIVDKFNKKQPIGSVIKWRSNPFVEYQELTVLSKAFLSNSGAPVVFFEERLGFCSIDATFCG